MWLLTGTRPGEISQQRAVAAALGLPYREVAVAQQALAGGRAVFDFSALQAPWPQLAISFGKTLDAAVELRRRAPDVRIVQIGRPRGIAWSSLDLIVPMPQDVIGDASNILPARMPFNPRPPTAAPAILQRLAAHDWPRPWTLLALGGVNRQYRFDAVIARQLIDDSIARVRAHKGSLLIATSPRTPTDVIALLSAPLGVPGECHVFKRGDADNPFAAYLQLADEIVLSGDSPSMIAECWRSAKPLLVRPLRRTLRYWVKRQTRRLIRESVMQSGAAAAALDINAWLARLAGEGHIGIFGHSEPRIAYRPELDTDLSRVSARIHELLAAPRR